MRGIVLLLLLPGAAMAAAADVGVPATVASVPAAEVGTAPAEQAAAGDAAAAPPPPAWAPQLRRDAQAVLEGKDFKGEETSTDIVRREWLRRLLERKDASPAKAPDLRWLPQAAELLKWLLVVVLALAIAWLLWRGWQWLAPRMGKPRTPVRPAPLYEATHLALPDTPLPDDVSRAARAAWQAGAAEQALSLLYRGALRALARDYRIELPTSATEGECLRRARASGKAVVGSGFAPVVQAWVALAYARRLPEDFEQLLDLYARHFERRAGAGEPT